MGTLLQIVITAVALWGSTLIPGIDLGEASTPAKAFTLLGVALVFGLVNAVVKPVVKFLGCLAYILTLGLFGLVVNALLFWFTSYLAGLLDLPFEVSGFWPAFWGAIVVALAGWGIGLVADRTRRAVRD
ncbi:phage holin family protein [Umezawaea beigongshangensis]|uniref:phage holin family protein n=1 Tax=Umezawaea beigongshangensis TaxID=2780383 RepID=UPI0018F2662B|nr:phage holin family protein [Umezawaea beigongshangensis]